MNKHFYKPALLSACLLAALLAFPEIGGDSQVAARISTRQPVRGDISYLKEVEKKIYRLTNEVRRKHGLLTLDQDNELAALARRHSEDMLIRKYFSHVNPDNLSPRDRLIPAYSLTFSRSGENIWSGSGHDASDSLLLARLIVDSWMTSPGHRANLLNPDYTHVGVGVAAMGREIRVTQVFVKLARK
jgi:uncharacterized protein YkwD